METSEDLLNLNTRTYGLRFRNLKLYAGQRPSYWRGQFDSG